MTKPGMTGKFGNIIRQTELSMPNREISEVALDFDAVVMLTWSNWKTEARSNRFHYATRFAKRLPVLFVQATEPPDDEIEEATEIDNIHLIHAGAAYDGAQTNRLQRVISDKGFKRVLFWVYNVNFADFISRNTSQFIIYHATEDYFGGCDKIAMQSDPERLRGKLVDILTTTDMLVAVSEGVLASYTSNGKYLGRSIVLENGCDFDFWRKSGASDFVPPQSGRPIALYQGNVNNRLDFKLLDELTNRMADWDFYFLGGDIEENQWLRIKNKSNVKYLGFVSTEEIARISKESTVAIIPYLDVDLMRISLPLKAYEYVACGLPVVSTPIDRLSEAPQLFSIAATAEEFEQAIRAVAPTRENADLIGMRAEAAKKQSYDQRFDELLCAVDLARKTFSDTARKLKLLILYDDRSNHVKTVVEHLESFQKYSKHEVYYMPCTHNFADLEKKYGSEGGWNPGPFDAIVVHYCVRVSLDAHLNENVAKGVESFSGPKILFIQDEYNTTETARGWIERLRFDIVFTGVPATYVESIYPRERFPNTRFIQTLTGYVPEIGDFEALSKPLAQRKLWIAYRGRDLPHHYGELAQEKNRIGLEMKRHAEERGVPVDIAVDTASRVYGDDWYPFLSSARATLGTESGSNVFDFDGTLSRLSKAHTDMPYAEFREKFLRGREGPVRMNQLSPKIFEAIKLRTALVLFEGEYSKVVEPHRHFIPLKKDFSNASEVFEKLEDLTSLQAMVDRAYDEIILTDEYSYKNFIQSFDSTIESLSKKRSPVRFLSSPLFFDFGVEGRGVGVSSFHPFQLLVSNEIVGEGAKREALLEQQCAWLEDLYLKGERRRAERVAVKQELRAKRAAAKNSRKRKATVRRRRGKKGSLRKKLSRGLRSVIPKSLRRRLSRARP